MSKTYKRWTKEEMDFIANNSATMKVDGSRQITVGMVRRQRRKLSISKPRGRRPSAPRVSSENNAV
jgi:hypothetical protein